MNEIDNPNAYPMPAAFYPNGERDHVCQDGMTLRDYFAGQCLAGWFACPDSRVTIEEAKTIWDMADNMIRTRTTAPTNE